MSEKSPDRRTQRRTTIIRTAGNRMPPASPSSSPSPSYRPHPVSLSSPSPRRLSRGGVTKSPSYSTLNGFSLIGQPSSIARRYNFSDPKHPNGITVHSVNVKTVRAGAKETAFGACLYEAHISCRAPWPTDPHHVHHWFVQFTVGEWVKFRQLYSSHILGRLYKSVKDKIKVRSFGAASGASTLSAARADRTRRWLWKSLHVFAALGLIIATTMFHRRCIWPAGTSTTFLVLVSCVPWVGLWYAWNLIMYRLLPSKMFLEYHQNLSPEILGHLDEILKAQSQNQRGSWPMIDSDHLGSVGNEDEDIVRFLRLSSHTLRTDMVGAVKEGEIYFRLHSREAWEQNEGRGTAIDFGCCRCALQVGFDKQWHRRWAVLRSSGISLFRRPRDDSPTDVLLFDVTYYFMQQGRRRGAGGGGRACCMSFLNGMLCCDPGVQDVRADTSSLVVVGSNWVIEMAVGARHQRKAWAEAIRVATSSQESEWTSEHRYGASAPIRGILPAQSTVWASKNAGESTDERPLSLISPSSASASASSLLASTKTASFIPMPSPDIEYHHDDSITSMINSAESRSQVPCHARWLLNGRSYFAAVRDAICSAKSQIFITGWFFSPEALMSRKGTGCPGEEDETISGLLRAAALRGVQVYVLLWHEIDHFVAGNNSSHAMHSLNQLNEGLMQHRDTSARCARKIHVLRHRSRFSENIYWSHHEKTVVVDQTVAFVGGIDIAFGRYDDGKHVLNGNKHIFPGMDYSNVRVHDFSNVEDHAKGRCHVDRTRVPRQPWRDVACQVWGMAANDVARHFIERWSHARSLSSAAVAGTDIYDAEPALQLRLPSINLQDGYDFSYDTEGPASRGVAAEWPPTRPPVGHRYRCQAQVLRSVSRWSAGTFQESSIHSAYCSMIESAKEFVYIENQFFASDSSTSASKRGSARCNRVASALARRVRRAIECDEKFRVVVVMPLLPGFDGNIRKGESSALLTVMQHQYETICRGESGDSFVEQIELALRMKNQQNRARAAVGSERTYVEKTVEDYVQFLGLRSWGILPGCSKPSGCSDGERVLTTESVYVHSKTMIVDDRATIIGSANVNDRSLLGLRDSEVCLCIESTAFAKDMREASMANFFGVTATSDKDKMMCTEMHRRHGQRCIDFTDWLDDNVWAAMRSITAHNTSVFRDVFMCIPCDTITSWESLEQARLEAKHEQARADEEMYNCQAAILSRSRTPPPSHPSTLSSCISSSSSSSSSPTLSLPPLTRSVSCPDVRSVSTTTQRAPNAESSSSSSVRASSGLAFPDHLLIPHADDPRALRKLRSVQGLAVEFPLQFLSRSSLTSKHWSNPSNIAPEVFI